MTTLINALQTHDKTFSLETMCVGGGQGMAMIVERLSRRVGAAGSSELRRLPGSHLQTGCHGWPLADANMPGPKEHSAVS